MSRSEHRDHPFWSRRRWLRGAALAAASGQASGALSRAEGDGHGTLSALTFNILAGGTRRGPLHRCVDLIRSSGADIIGLQEVGGSGPELAEATGFYRFERGSKQILSRYPISTVSPGRRGVKIDVPDLGEIWFFNIHFRPAPYQPYQLMGIPYGRGRFIETADEAVAEALRARGDQVDGLIRDMEPALSSGLPILLSGDFNEPSHLDWSERAADEGCCKLPVRWPASERVTVVGMTDLYRQVYPDELSHRGYTWTPTPAPRDVMDRIDFLYGRGVEAVSAAVIGESEDHADTVINPYPSDHRAVLARCRVTLP